MLNDVLFELGTEELPSASVWPLADALASNLIASLKEAGLSHQDVKRYATPRRIGVIIKQVSECQPTQKVMRRGPSCNASFNTDGTPSKALLGFANACGVSIEHLNTVKTNKGEWWVFETMKQGAGIIDLLPHMIRDALKALPMSRPMRWGSGEEEFARPVHWAVLMYGDTIIKTKVLGVTSNNVSYGHRFHHSEALVIPHPNDYEQLLFDAYVVADFHKRRQMIIEQVDTLAKSRDFLAVMPEDLLNEVTSIVEWPEALLASFESEFLEVPSEALIAAMQLHQKSFALRNTKGQLQPYFITVANIASRNPEQVIVGNEKVMRARLSDAQFFYHKDLHKRLSDYMDDTKHVVFQTKLGTLYDKTRRMQTILSTFIQPLNLDETLVERACELSKCDLMTGMVGEFPELQGIMGYYYALNDGENEQVAQALFEQYKPRFAADDLPETTLGMALSLADRLDTLVGIFGVGQKPTGVKDPFKLRRHALAVVRLLIALPTPINLSTLIEQTLQVFSKILPKSSEVKDQLHSFILERLQSHYLGQGIRLDVIQAVRKRQQDWLYDVDKRIKALTLFIKRPEASSLSGACKRVDNMLQHSSAALEFSTIDENLLQEAIERDLFDHVEAVEKRITPLYSAGDYERVLEQLAGLREVVDTFFEQVMVMVDDEIIKRNRLCLLHRLQRLLQGVADISLLSI